MVGVLCLRNDAGRSSLVRCQDLNPVDYMFYVTGRVLRGFGLADANIQLIIELGGTLDVKRFRRTVAALQRVYPVMASRLVRSDITGRPRWRLDADPPDLPQVVQVRSL